MTETRTRLEEAKYFLERMKETLHQPYASTQIGHFGSWKHVDTARLKEDLYAARQKTNAHPPVTL